MPREQENPGGNRWSPEITERAVLIGAAVDAFEAIDSGSLFTGAFAAVGNAH